MQEAWAVVVQMCACMWCVNICASVFNNQSILMSGIWSICYILYSELWVRNKNEYTAFALGPFWNCPLYPMHQPHARQCQPWHQSTSEAQKLHPVIAHLLAYNKLTQITKPASTPREVRRNRQLGSGKVSIHLWLGGTGLRSPASPRSTHPLTQSSQLLSELISKLPRTTLPSPTFMPDITQGQSL